MLNLSTSAKVKGVNLSMARVGQTPLILTSSVLEMEEAVQLLEEEVAFARLIFVLIIADSTLLSLSMIVKTQMADTTHHFHLSKSMAEELAANVSVATCQLQEQFLRLLIVSNITV